MSGERAAPAVVNSDRTHYLHSADVDVPSFERRHIRLACQSQVALLRWHKPGEQAHTEAVLNIEHGPCSLYLAATAEQLRLMAYAMLQCATDLDAATLPPPAAPGALVDIGTLERRPWAVPTATTAQAA